MAKQVSCSFVLEVSGVLVAFLAEDDQQLNAFYVHNSCACIANL